MTSAFKRKLQRYVNISTIDCLALSDELTAVRRVPAHAEIVREGEDADVVHVLLEGWAGRCRRFSDGRQQIVSLLVPGDCGDWDVPLLARRDCAVVALTSVAVASVPGSAIRRLEERSPALRTAFQRDMLLVASVQAEALVSLGRRSAIERMAHLFCELHARLAVVDLAEETSYVMPVSQDNLADVLGLSTVHINRTLMELRSLELISLRGRSLTVHDGPGLARLAHFDPGYLHVLRINDVTGRP